MTLSEELWLKLRADFISKVAAWPPEELEKVLAKLPRSQREGWNKLIEDHQKRTQK